ncbi:TonB family protein [Oceanobacter mangrovi]|uniref:TonB family protein n=1 Tax=Oceanobacter mangrovi TaxID=2862510 RepID=UPI001C8E3710|nr:TonB family protein [Oceanobacter mangrovi]
MRVSTLFLLVGLILSLPALALELQGSAVYRRLDNDVYLAAVYADSAASQSWLTSSDPLRLEMVVLAENLSPRRFYRLWNEGLAINLSEAEMNQHVDEVTRFMHLLKGDLLAGDHLLVSNESGQSVVSVNGVTLLTLEDPDFVKLLLTSWIGKFPRSQAFKMSLTQMSAEMRGVRQSEVDLLQPAEGRADVIASWLVPQRAAQPATAVAAVAVTQETRVPTTGAVVDGVDEQTATGSQSSSLTVTTPEPADEPGMQTLAQNELSSEQQQALREAAEQAATELAARQAIELAQQQAQQQQLLQQQIARQQAEADYYRHLLQQANGSAVYPKQALRRGVEGVARVVMVVNRTGQLIQAETSESSGQEVLDRAALQAAGRAAPYGPIPEVLEGNEFEFEVPFRFVMNHQ